MFYQPDLFILVLMLPVLFLLVIPSLWAMFGILYRGVGRSCLANTSGFVEVKTTVPEGDGNIERRHQDRVLIEGPKAVVAYKVNCCHTYVSNISSKGICLSNIPQKMFEEANDKFRIIFRSREREFTMLVQPRWRKSEDSGYMIGTEILTIPAGWEGYVNEFCQPSLAKAA